MFTPLLISLAMTGAGPASEPIVIVEDRPSIIIPLGRYDLARAEGVGGLKREIVRAARRVCDRGYRGSFHVETIACVAAAKADANAQLDKMLGANFQAAAATATIAVSAPAN